MTRDWAAALLGEPARYFGVWEGTHVFTPDSQTVNVGGCMAFVYSDGRVVHLNPVGLESEFWAWLKAQRTSRNN